MTTTTRLMFDQMQAEIQAIENDVALRAEINFVGRADALDRIEFHLLDRMDDDGNELVQRAQILRDQFAAIDEEIFRRVRAGIANGTLRGECLRQEFDHHVRKPVSSERGYDQLDVFVNGLLRLDTIPHETRTREPEMVFYQPTPARVILELTEMMLITRDDIFYDLGSGLGQVCILVHLLTGARTHGIEFEPAYCDYARHSAQRLNLSSVQFINVDARDAPYADGTVFFMYTPFKGAMLANVLKKIKDATRGRAVSVCAYGECIDQVANEPWLELAAQRRTDVDALAVFKRSGP
ncbi:MAG: class I SAM-dependent methyltransferase [Chloroflexi bacterium]|nr:class I SAM-dependent methyltransferase [Chloroflexota bacterium]